MWEVNFSAKHPTHIIIHTFWRRSCKLSVVIACSETVKLDIAGYFELELDIIIGYS